MIAKETSKCEDENTIKKQEIFCLWLNLLHLGEFQWAGNFFGWSRNPKFFCEFFESFLLCASSSDYVCTFVLGVQLMFNPIMWLCCKYGGLLEYSDWNVEFSFSVDQNQWNLFLL